MTDKETKLTQSSKPTDYASELKGKSGFGRIIKAATYSRDGFTAAYKNEAAFRQVVWINALLCIIMALAPFAIVIKMVLLFASVLSLIVELFNTGLEAAIDHTSTKRHPLAKIAKDVGSAAQLCALVLLFILWVMAIYSLI